MDSRMFGYLAAVAFVCLLVFATGMFVHTRRIRLRPVAAFGEEVGGTKAMLNKVRKLEPMTQAELDFAKQAIADRSSLLAFSIPATIFSLGCFYVLGSLEHLHGATPSERTFLGVIPMFSSLNITMQILRNKALKRRIPRVPVVTPQPA